MVDLAGHFLRHQKFLSYSFHDVLLIPKSIIIFFHVLFTAEGHSIYVRNLPYNATDTQLEEEFKKFGPIKHGGIQVRSNKVWFCYYLHLVLR